MIESTGASEGRRDYTADEVEAAQQVLAELTDL